MNTPEQPMSDDETEAVAELDAELAQRTLIVKIDDSTGELEVDYEGIAPWELSGISDQLAAIADEEMRGDQDEDE